MADLGYVSDSEAAVAIAEPLDLQPNGYFRQKRESFFFDYVTDELIKGYGQRTCAAGA